ncbi:probable serpin E3 isoform X2 [Pristis pectinata]|uniref:probable serpin E3 isoform X2 n=1 Tax=Pristis pectinata TaxID=685728 RepID=UPI00223D402C|nr:probable serpin E3 isoform X2 [Pristis pectinata]
MGSVLFFPPNLPATYRRCIFVLAGSKLATLHFIIMCSFSILNLLLHLLFTWRSCAFQDIRQRNTEFALNLYQQFTEAEEYRNFVISPAGITFALGLLQLGAKGETSTQLENALGYTVHDSRVQHFLQTTYGDLTNSNHSPTIQLACGLFVESSIQLSPKFSEDMAVWVNGSLQRVNFGNPNETATLINKWVGTRSRGEIEDFISRPIENPSLAQIAVISTMHFKSKWQNPFSLSETQHFTFTKADGSVIKVPMMYQTSEVNYGQIKTGSNQRFIVVELSYLEHTVSMFIIIPSERKKSISQVEPHITAQTLSTWTKSMRRMKMEVFLPRFKVKSKFNLKTVLKTLGITDLFSPSKADFRGISEHEKLFVSEAIHEARIEVTEDGTEAAAATAMVLLKRSRALVFKADRPFFFLLRHLNTGTIVFMGRVMDPLE